jgi:hypothetical protein
MMPKPKTDKPPLKVIREGDSGPESDAVSCTWTGYLNGHWTQDKPTRPGRYLVATRDGRLAGVIVFYRDKVTGGVTSTNTWGGWFWSFPMPPPPVSAPPEWPEEECHLQLVKDD